VTGPPCWMPLHLLPSETCTDLMVEWFDARSLRFDDPFFVETVYRAQYRHQDDPGVGPFRRQTPIADMLDQAAAEPGIDPAGFVFHLARCGSTLVAQMLAALPDHIVLSEAPAIDAVLRTRFWTGASEEERAAWLRAAVGTLGRKRNVEEKRLFIKFDAWHTIELPLLRSAFPGVPWIFLYRDPVEVLVSHERSTAALTIPGAINPAVFGLDLADVVDLSPMTYAARVTAAIGEAALQHLDELGRLVRYDELPAALEGILSHFSVEVAAAELDRMNEVAGDNAKARGMPFVADAEAKQAEASDEVLAAAALVAPVIERIEQVRSREPAVVA
jgi:hypothetical protein